MNAENTKKIIESFPNLYSNKDPREPFNYNGGFECGDGWFTLIYELSARLENILLKMNVRERADFQVVQVKEKFGTLRFYMSSFNEEMRNLISIAEAKSAETCETCGEPGRIRSGSWIAVTCDSCEIESVLSKVVATVLNDVEEYSYENILGKTVKSFRLKDEEKFYGWAMEYVKGKLTPVVKKNYETK